MLIEYLSKDNEKVTDNQGKIVFKNSFYIPNNPTEKQAQEVLIQAGIKESLEEIMGLSSRDFSAYRASSEYSEEQKSLLQKIRYKRKEIRTQIFDL